MCSDVVSVMHSIIEEQSFAKLTSGSLSFANNVFLT